VSSAYVQFRDLPLTRVGRAELLQAAKVGEPDAIDELIRRHREWLRAKIATHYSRRLSDVDDLEQETWIRVMRLLPTWDRPDGYGFLGWLKSIAKGVCHSFYFNHSKTQKEENRSTLEDVPPSLWAFTGTDPEQGAVETERKQRIQRILDTLEPHNVEMLLRCDLGGESQEAVAASLRRSLSQVRQAICRTRYRFLDAAKEEPALSESLSFFPEEPRYQRVEYDRTMVERFLASGMTVGQFTKTAGIDNRRFHHWLERFREESNKLCAPAEI
jgi:RNA polymerase sigma factor (sigma-70 family)